MSTITATPLQACKIALFLAAYDNRLLALNDAHYGTEFNIDLQNTAADYASHALGVDVTEDEEWVAYCNKATSSEINQFTIIKLMNAFSAEIPSCTPLSIVALELPGVQENWKEQIVNAPDMFDFFTPDQLTVDAGWTAQEVDLLSAREVGQMLPEFGDFYHTLIRLR